jgi:hypothetical protein
MHHKFAHITDCHLGAWRNPKLREINLRAFERAVSICISEKVDFIVITGDFFDVSVPELEHVKYAVEIMRNAKSRHIEIYMIYGSHDFTASTVSIIDILQTAGLFIKPVEFERIRDKMRLKFVQDQKKGFKVTGLSGRQSGLDRHYYRTIDIGALESEEGIKIFLFHIPIAELTPADLAYGGSIPLSQLPKGFKYYGGGHLHRRIEYKHNDGKSFIIYPGPLFGSTFTDLEDTADGELRGFYVIEYDSDSESISANFIEVKIVDIILRTMNVNRLTTKQVEDKISLELDNMEENLRNKIVLIKVKGTLLSGKRSDINFSQFEEHLSARGALLTFINRNSLFPSEVSRLTEVIGTNIGDIEKNILRARISSFRIDPTIADNEVQKLINSKLVAGNGEYSAINLLSALKMEKIENETVNEYDKRVLMDAKTVLGLEI